MPPTASSLETFMVSFMTEKDMQFLTQFMLNTSDICFSCSECYHKVLAEHGCWTRVRVAVMRPQDRGYLGCMCPTVLSCVELAARCPLNEPVLVHPFPEVSLSQLWAAQGIGWNVCGESCSLKCLRKENTKYN